MRRTFASPTAIFAATVIVLGLSTLLLSACNGSAGPMSGAIPASHRVTPLTGRATPTPIPFVYTTVNNPNSKVNMVTGINQLAKIVGVYGGGSASNIMESYSATSPYQQFRSENYPGAQGTTATSLTSNKTIAGYVFEPQQLKGIWAFVRANGVWSIFKDRKEGGGKHAVTELLGINDSKMAVGFYLDANGTSIPLVVDTINEQFTALKPPGSIGAEATGINGKGNISGTETTSSGVIGFFLQTGTYYTLSYPNALATQALSLNWQNQIVGEYQDKSGIHGFVLTYPTNGGKTRVWQSVDEPNAVGTTVVTGIDNHDDICGWYIDGSGYVDGFVAKPKGG